MAHLSDSAVQREAEALIVAGLADVLGVHLVAGGRIDVGAGAHVQVDARSADGEVLVEACARHGALKGAQLKKVGQDVLKFALLRQSPQWAGARMVVAFASVEAQASIRGWVAQAARAFDVEMLVVELPDKMSARVVAAQQRQVMVNLSADEAVALGVVGTETDEADEAEEA